MIQRFKSLLVYSSAKMMTCSSYLFHSALFHKDVLSCNDPLILLKLVPFTNRKIIVFVVRIKIVGILQVTCIG